MSDGAVVIGSSAGGLDALRLFLPRLPSDFPLPLLLVQHVHRESRGCLPRALAHVSPLPVHEAEDKERIRPGVLHVAPPDYHLLVESDRTLALSVDPKVNYARPSIDVLFASAADVYRASLIGVILTGANRDGSAGLLRVKQQGGHTLVQDPTTAASTTMPRAAIETAAPAVVAPVEELVDHLTRRIRSMQQRRAPQPTQRPIIS